MAIAAQTAPTNSNAGSSSGSGSAKPAGDEPELPALGDYKEAFSAIDDLDGHGDGGSPEPQPDRQPKSEKKPEAKPKPDGKQDPKPEAKPKPDSQPKKRQLGDDLESLVKKPEEPEKADEPDIPEEKEDPTETDMFESAETPKKLREVYRTTKAELEKSSGRIKELEAAVEKAKIEGSETVRKEYESKLSDIEKSRSELETTLRFLDYERSEDYKSKYATPLKQAWKDAMSTIEGMTVPDGEGGEREVTPQDLMSLMQLPNAQARKAAHEMFGTAGPEIMEARKKLLSLTSERDKALDEWRQKGSERDAAIAKQRQEVRQRWEADVTGYQNEYPEVFGASPEDTEAKGLISKGILLAKRALLAEGIPDGLTPDQRREAVLEAQTQLTVRAAAFPRVLRDLNKSNARIKELEAKLKEYEESEPELGSRRFTGEGKRERAGNPEDDIDNIPGV